MQERIPLAAGLHRDGTIEMAHNCRECGVPLVIGENVTQYGVDHSNYICRNCCAGNARKYRHKHPKLQRERQMEYLHRIGRCHPMHEINHLVGITISETKLDRWAKYEQPIEQVLDCCNIIKETKKHD